MQESIILLSDLQELENIIDTIQPDEYISPFNEEHTCDFYETILHLMDTYIEEHPNSISDPEFNDYIIDEIREIIYIQLEDLLFFNEELEEEIDDLIEEAIEIYFMTICGSRYFENVDYTDNNIIDNNVINNNVINNNIIDNNVINNNVINNNVYEKNKLISEKLDYLRNIPQPVQRTPEWYQFRHNLITASNAYKAFENQSTINQLIYEKCQPLKINNSNEEEKIKLVNTNSTLHWGQKYEPLSVMIYEYLYNTKVEDFGCIQHKSYKFIGASPDGINVDKKSDKYGRMLEIKNVVNREITGIPKKEYWIQMQLQMEVCDLDDCDFLETKFVEYSNSDEFYGDVLSDNKDNDKMKGLIIYFHTKDTKPYYIYKPLNIIEKNDIIKWEEEIVDLYTSDKYNMQFIKIIYWKLEKISCIYVQRNKKWFEDNIKQLEKVWSTIEEERITGFQHRAPIKKIKKEVIKNQIPISSNQGCLLPISSKKNTFILSVDTEKL